MNIEIPAKEASMIYNGLSDIYNGIEKPEWINNTCRLPFQVCEDHLSLSVYQGNVFMLHLSRVTIPLKTQYKICFEGREKSYFCPAVTKVVPVYPISGLRNAGGWIYD